MQRKAIVIVPSEEDYKARTEAQEKAECKDVPDNAVMEMKGIKNQLLKKRKLKFKIFLDFLKFQLLIRTGQKTSGIYNKLWKKKSHYTH